MEFTYASYFTSYIKHQDWSENVYIKTLKDLSDGKGAYEQEIR